jgi:hypothetical protein
MNQYEANLWRRIWAAANWLAIIAAVWLAPAIAFAQRRRAEAPKEPEQPSYALEYGLVIFLIMLGVAIVFRPSRRAEPVDDVRLPLK